MSGLLNIFNLGSHGVNVDKNPVQLEDGELTKSQNAIHDPTGSMGGIRKRPGLVKVNSSAVSGSVFGITNVPLAPITTRRFLIGVDQDTTTAYQWFTSTDAMGTLSTTTSPAACARPDDTSPYIGTHILSNRGIQGDAFFLYPGDYTRGNPQPIRLWDGTVDRELFQIPLNPSAMSNEPTNYATSVGAVLNMLLAWPKLYIVSHDFTLGAAPHYSRILEYNFETGALLQIGQGTSVATGDISASDGGSGIFTCCAFHQGYLYAGVGPAISGETCAASGVYRIRPGVDTVWTYDLNTASAGQERPMCMASYKGKLYVGFQDFNTATQRVLVRDYAGAYTSSTTQGTLTGSAFVDMKVFGDNLYVTSLDENGASSQTRIHKYTGSAWSIAKTIDSATSTPRVGVAMVEHNSRLYVLGINSSRNGIVTHTADGSSWTDQSTTIATSTNVVSIFGVLTD